MKFTVFGHTAELKDNLRYEEDDRPGRLHPLQGWLLRRLVGLDENRLEKDKSMKPVQLGNIWVYLLTAKEAQVRHPRSHRPHRLWAVCYCGENVAAGRLQQHLRQATHGNGSNIERIRAASVALHMTWTPYDVQTLKADWNVEQCIEFLRDNRKYIEEAMTSTGYEIMRGLLP